MPPLRFTGLSAALALAACAGTAADHAQPNLKNPPPRTDASATREALLSPARYVFTDRLGVKFDEAGTPAQLPRPEPAIIDGVRFLVDNGVAISTAPGVERFTGFRGIPARLGGGYVIWSDARVYRADTFLGELKPIADVGASGGVRPFMKSILLRTDVGVLEVDPASLTVHRVNAPGLADALSVDARRAVRIDALGRATVTSDGGASWIDLLDKRAAVITFARETPDGDLLLSGPGSASNLRIGKNGEIGKPKDPPRPPPWSSIPRTSAPLLTAFPTSSRSLPGEIFAQAVVAGAFLPPEEGRRCLGAAELCAPSSGQGRILVARDKGIRALSATTVLPLADADLLGVDEKFGRCQPFALVSAAITAVCVQDEGGLVLDVSDALSRPKLEITFPDPGVFVAGPRGRFGFTGRCGAQPPSSTDLGKGTPPPREGLDEDPTSPSAMPSSPPPPNEPALPDLPPADDARFCLRRSADHWIERRLRGAAARRLYRFVPGDDGRVTALILGRDGEDPPGKEADDKEPKGKEPKGKEPKGKEPKGKEPKGKEPKGKAKEGDKGAASDAGAETIAGDGVRVIHLDPDDPALKGGAFPTVLSPQKEPPYRSVDVEFWEDDDGAIRGWVRLPPEGESTSPVAASAQGPAARLLRVQPRRGGPAAGVRIDDAGHLTLFAPPEGTTEVVTGGRLGLAMAVKDDVPSYFETTDGGRTWTPVEGPPVGRIEAPSDDSAPFGCSPIGCTWASGMVRLGWGGPPPKPRPSPAEKPTFTAAANPLLRGPKPPAITCRLDTDTTPWAGEPPRPIGKPPPPPRPKTPIAPGTAAPLSPPKPRPSTKEPPKNVAPAKSDMPPLPISLRMGGSASIGALRDHAWTGDVWLPLQPGAAPKHLSVNDRALTMTLGSVVPLLDASPRAPLDMLLIVDKRRLRVGAPGTSFLPFDIQAKTTVAADGPDGLLVTLDADKGILWISRGDATSTAIRLVRVPDVARTRLTLARRLDGRGLSLVGYSTSTGEVFAGDIDLTRAEIGPLMALGRIESILEAGSGACAGQRASRRFLAEVPSALSILGKGGQNLFDGSLSPLFLLEADGERLCAVGLEVGIPKGTATDLTVTFGKGGGPAAVRSQAKGARGTCAITPGK